MAATARMAPAMMASPAPMKNLVTVALDIGVSFDGWWGMGLQESVGQTVMATFPRACPAPTWPIANAVSVSG